MKTAKQIASEMVEEMENVRVPYMEGDVDEMKLIARKHLIKMVEEFCKAFREELQKTGLSAAPLPKS